MAEEQKKSTLTELSSITHADLKMNPIGALKVAATQHMINVKVGEIGMAVSSFPVLMSRSAEGANWNFSVVNSFELGDNLFVENNAWTGTYLPIGMQTYPFFLMRSTKDEKSFTVGIDEQNDVFSKEEGEALFEDSKASVRLSQATAQLEHDVKHDMQSYKFAKKIEELGLIRSIDLQIHYHSGQVNTLTGLNTINEQDLYKLETEQFEELRQEGYLLPLFAMLTSIYQFNNMIKLHNLKYPEKTIAEVKLEEPKEQNGEA